MARIRSFPPIADAAAQTLILGTMPGAASLQARQYYAHPRNAFWQILADLLGFDPNLDYAARKRHAIAAGVAVWDVLQSCERRGSLDAKIESSSIVTNDFERFFACHPRIETVCFNGATAERLYRRHVLPTLSGIPRNHVRLPSTSPANAGIPASRKARLWRAAFARTRTEKVE
jgi:double-stranded uracil-DNA glycosylase